VYTLQFFSIWRALKFRAKFTKVHKAISGLSASHLRTSVPQSLTCLAAALDETRSVRRFGRTERGQSLRCLCDSR
jgi:hypothetical protein